MIDGLSVIKKKKKEIIKNEKIIIPASGCSAIINVVTNRVLIPVWKQNGAAVASVASELLTNSIQFVYMRKKIKVCLELRDLKIAVISTILMMLVVIGIMNIEIPTVLALVIEVMCGAIVYMVSNIMLKNSLLVELLQIVKSKYKK